MKNPIILSFPGNNTLSTDLANKLQINIGSLEIRNFPDGESYVRIHSNVKNRVAILVCELSHPNEKILPLIFVAETLKELGASKVCLISPYLPYMRQDKRFNPGEALTSALFAKSLSNCVDYLVTVDPHLHRIQSLSDIYFINSISALHSTKAIAEWVSCNIDSPFIIGPDEESQQWVAEVANIAVVPFAIIKKIRYGDRKVSISVPEIKDIGKTLVLIDDIISTGTSMLAVIHELVARGFKNFICIGIHALFDDKVYKNLLSGGAQQVITCNTIPHPSNKIDITDILVEEVKRLQLC